MKLEQVMLTLGGLTILGAFFLPFIQLPGALVEADQGYLTVSGISAVEGTLNNFDLIESNNEEEDTLPLFLEKMWNSAQNFQGLALVIGLIFVLAGPIWFGLHALGYIFRGLRGKQYGRGIFFTIFFMGIGWLVFYLLGQEFEQSMGFFQLVGPGFWVAFAGMLVAAFSLLFEKPGGKKG